MIAFLIFLVTLCGGILLTNIPQIKKAKDALSPYSSLTGFVLLFFGVVNLVYGFFCLFDQFFLGLAAMIAGVVFIHAGGMLYMGLSFIPKNIDDIIAKATKPVLAITAPLKPVVGYILLAIAVIYLVDMIF